MVQYDPSWISKAKRQHLVPNTYLKAWSIDEDHVYFIDKNEETVDFTQEEFYRRTKNLTIINEFYSRNIHSSKLEDIEFEEIFKPLISKSYSVKFNGDAIVELSKLWSLFYEFNKWAIYDSTRILISEEDKQALKKEIEKVQTRNIEEAWNRLFENTWRTTRETILQAVKSNQGKDKINAVKREELILFMVAVEWRTYPPHQLLIEAFNRITTLFGKDFQKVMSEQLEEDEKHLSVINTLEEKFLHEIKLELFIKYFNNTGPIYDQFLTIFNDMAIELLVPEAGTEFITSDNPVRTFNNTNHEVEYIFPICPTLACAVRKNSKNQDKSEYLVTTYSKEETIIFNNKTKQSSYKGYVLKQPQLTPYFG